MYSPLKKRGENLRALSCALYILYVKATRIASLLFLLLLAFPLAASAKQPIPGIKQTAEWKNMKNYVSLLQSLQNTPATPAQKQAFTNNLSSKQIATNNRVKALYSRTIQRITNRDQRAEQKQIRKVRNSEKEQIQELQAQKKRALQSQQSKLSARQSAIRSGAKSQIASAQKNLRRLQASLRKTTNPFRREIILANINTTKTNISRLQGSLQRKLQDAASASAKKSAAIKKSFVRRADSTRARFQEIVQKIQSAWKKIYRDDVQAAKERRQSQFQLVSNLRQRGAGYIAAMPAAS